VSKKPAATLDELLARPYKHIRLKWRPDSSALSVEFCVTPIQCFSLSALSELAQMCADIDNNMATVRHLMVMSGVQGVFNFGGDLALFVLLARAKNLASLKMYGRLCVQLVWWLETAPQRGLHTVAVVQGDALGGGLESILPASTLVMERDAQAGFPEVMFNLYPGMGAWHFTARKAGFAVANQMVLSGAVYSGERLKELGVVDHLAEPGQGVTVAEQAIRNVEPRLRGTINALRARALAIPITLESLHEVVDLWAECALGITDRDMRLMERLARAQLKKVGGSTEGAIEEIKRMELEQALAAAA
jgi:DSF synthase